MGKNDKAFWEKVNRLFEEISGLPEPGQETYLDEHCDDTAMRKELESLLKFRDPSERYFDSLVESLILPSYEKLPDLLPFSGRAGHYRIIEKIGDGGMGSVFLAERDDDVYESRVAVKILRQGIYNEELLSRFRRERQTLARLNHPNIARLLDGGISDQGLPYFVMENVEGKPVTEWCDEQRLSLRRRLELFHQICEALKYIHQNLIVHRDLKPENILVTNEGQVKLLDFGISKLLDEETDATNTITGMRLMTPRYASPEQVQGLPFTTATDVYQLGVLLYELLCGCPPFETSDRTLRETEQLILDQDPKNPDQKVGELEADIAADIARKRSTSLKLLIRHLKGDLAAITQNALHKEPERRYHSVEELQQDIKRYQRGHPIRAKRNNLRYKAGKFISRNRYAVAAASMVILMLAGMGAYHHITITKERNIAVSEAAKAGEIKDFMVDLIQSLDPSEVRGEPVSATLLLDRGAERILESGHDDPEVQGELLLTLADVYQSLDLLDQSREMVSAFFDHYEQAATGESPVSGLQELALQARLQQAFLLSEVAEYEQALEKYEAIKADIDIGPPDMQAFSAGFYSDYALNFKLMGDLEKSDSLFRHAIALHEDLYDPDHPELARVKSRYATVLTEVGDQEGSKRYNLEVLVALRRNYGDIHPEVLRETNNLATTYTRMERYEEADSLFGEAYKIANRLFDGKHTIIGIILSNHANVKANLGEYELSLQKYEETLQVRRDMESYYHPTTGFATMGMSNVLIKLDRHEEARQCAEETLELFGYGLPPGHWTFDLARVLLNEAKFGMGEFDPEMTQTVHHAFESLKSARGLDDSYTVRSLEFLIDLHQFQGNFAKAEELQAYI